MNRGDLVELIRERIELLGRCARLDCWAAQ